MECINFGDFMTFNIDISHLFKILVEFKLHGFGLIILTLQYTDFESLFGNINHKKNKLFIKMIRKICIF